MSEFISILTKLEGGDSPKITKNIFDKEFIFDNIKDYNKIYNFCLNSKKDKQVYITKEMHHCIPIISGLNEKHMYQNNDEFNSQTKILFFSNYHEIDDSSNNSTISQLMGWTKCLFDEHKLTIKPEQIILIGLNDMDFDLELDELDNLNIEYYTLSFIKKKGIRMILEQILNNNQNKKIITYFNLEVFNKKIAPSVNRRNFSYDLLENINDKNINNGLEYGFLEELSDLLKNKVNYLIISGLDKTIDNSETNFPSRLTSEVVQILYRNIMDIKESKINIFNENSRFLIFRELAQNDENDIGWYILRFIDMDLRQQLLKYVEDDKIYTFNLNDYVIEEKNILSDTDDDLENEILITATTIDDQNKKSYYLTKSIMECSLFPQEKFLMGFELVNF
jgi:hypothetical protein